MTALFALLVEALQAGIFGLSQLLGGSLPGGIVAMTLVVRVGMLPLTVRLARRARRRATAVAALKPQLDAVRERFADDPARLAARTVELYRSRGLAPVDAGAASGTLLQLPVLAAFFKAVRGILPSLEGRGFLWMRDLSAPSLLLAALASGIALLATAVGPPPLPDHPAWLRWVPAAGTLAVMLFVSSGFGLYLLASGAVSVAQAALVRRGEGHHRAG